MPNKTKTKSNPSNLYRKFLISDYFNMHNSAIQVTMDETIDVV